MLPQRLGPIRISHPPRCENNEGSNSDEDEVSINDIVEESGEDEEESEPLQNLPSADHSCSESSYDSQDPLQAPETVDAWIDPESQTSVTPVCDIVETCDMSQTYDPTMTFYMAR